MANSIMKWLEVDGPPSKIGVHMLVRVTRPGMPYVGYTVARYVEPMTEVTYEHEDEAWCDYNPDDEEYYYPEGWYENSHGPYSSEFLSGELKVTHCAEISYP